MFVEFFLVLIFSIPAQGNVFHDVEEFHDKMLPNFGVAFEKVGKLISTSTYWHHTFVISMPRPEDFRRQQGDDKRVLSSILDLDQQTDRLAKKAEDLISYANERLPKLPKGEETNARRKRSAPLGFVGSLSKTLFGTATMDDVRKIADLANRVSSASVIMSQELKKTTSTLHSYMKTANEQMENLAKLASKEHGQIEELEQQFQLSHQAQVANMQWMVHALAFVANRQTVMAGMDFTLTLMHSAITDLSQGILSDHLVSEKDFRAVFEELDKVKQGINRYLKNLELMYGFKVFPLIKICWTILTPAFTLGLFVLGVFSYSELTYDRKSVSYHYPKWAIAIGWMMASASIVWIPVVAIYRLFEANGSIKERLQHTLKPVLHKHQLTSREDLNKVTLVEEDIDSFDMQNSAI